MRRFYLCCFLSWFAVVSLPALGVAAGTLVLDDDFSNLDSWNTGTNTGVNSGGDTLSVDAVNDRVVWSQQYDYIETKSSYSGDVSIEFEVQRFTGSVQKWDFLVEFTECDSMSAMMRLRYGGDNYYRIGLGPAPSLTDGGDTGINVTDSAYQQLTLTDGATYKGVGKLTYQSGQMKFEFTGTNADKIETPWVSTPQFTSDTKIRIWGIGSVSDPRYLNWVKIYAPSGETPTDNVKVVVIPLCPQ